MNCKVHHSSCAAWDLCEESVCRKSIPASVPTFACIVQPTTVLLSTSFHQADVQLLSIHAACNQAAAADFTAKAPCFNGNSGLSRVSTKAVQVSVCVVNSSHPSCGDSTIIMGQHCNEKHFTGTVTELSRTNGDCHRHPFHVWTHAAGLTCTQNIKEIAPFNPNVHTPLVQCFLMIQHWLLLFSFPCLTTALNNVM